MTAQWTNLDDVRESLDRFACSEHYPNAIVLSGNWGTGKTHLWWKTLERNTSLAKPNYAYVSLFGINSLDDLKYQLFQVLETRKKDKPEVRKGFWGLYDRSRQSALDRWQKVKNWRAVKEIDHLSGEEKNFLGKLSLLKSLPYINKIEPFVRSISFNRIRETIVCIDDFERKGDSLRVVDVLGLVSLLRETRKSKVILILNADTLSKGDKKEFERLHEKVFDWEISLNPSPAHAVSCVVSDDDPQYSTWNDTAVGLKANNIRIIRRAYEFVKILRERYPTASDPIQQQFVVSLLLFCFVKFADKQELPTLQYLKDQGVWSFDIEEIIDQTPEQEEKRKEYDAILRAINWANTDEIDLELIRFVEQGYLSREALDEAVQAHEARLTDHEAMKGFEDAWKLLHHSLRDNTQEFTEALYSASERALKVVSPWNVDQSIRILRELGREEEADSLADKFVEANAETREKLDVSEYAFGNEMRDEYFLGRLQDALLGVPEDKNLHDVLIRLAESDGWGGSDEEYLDDRPHEDIKEFFDGYEGEDLPKLLKGAMNFSRISNPTERMTRITDKMREVLAEIAGQSEINARRLKNYGIEPNLDEEDRTA